MQFNSTFDKNCLAGNCTGWTTNGEYRVETSADGQNKLIVAMNLMSPLSLQDKIIKASIVFPGVNE